MSRAREAEGTGAQGHGGTGAQGHGSTGGRVLGVDWGERRFGLAISDPSRTIAQPLTTLTRRAGKRAPVAAIVALITTHDVSHVVVGLPLTPEGEEGEAARQARAVADALARRSGLPVTLWDERLSTAIALKAARRAGVSARRARPHLDRMAAVAILQHYLDARRAPGHGGHGGGGGAGS